MTKTASASHADAGTTETTPFEVRDCALIAIATGTTAQTLKELRDRLATITLDSLYYHFWGGLLEPRFEEREYNNDFAAWARHGLHDGKLAEQLAMIDPVRSPELEDLRQQLLEIIEVRLDESDFLPWARATHSFEFICSQIVVFDTRARIEAPEHLAEIIPHLTASSVFYHFIDARRRPPYARDDFSVWLDGFGDGYGPLRNRLAAIDPYFGSLVDLRHELTEACAVLPERSDQ